MPKIYFDNAATTPVDNAVVQAMLPYFESSFGNASSVHSYGLEAKHVLDSARATVADALKSKHHEIIFTSGGTEANNLAILGIANKYHSPQHIITSFIEHPSVLQPCKYLEKAGWQVTYLPVDAFGELNPQKLVEAIRDDTVLISLMTVNNETGVIQPVDKLAEIADAHNVPFHSDAVQAFGKTPIDLQKYKVSFLTISGHKIYGPKGVGALFIRKGMKLISTLIGGEQENKQRAGTENIPAIAGVAKAV
ncbi:MAG: cysteine desulfurase family protein, partial [bacterium]